MAVSNSPWGLTGLTGSRGYQKDYSSLWDYSGYGSPMSVTVFRPGAGQAGSGYGVPFEQQSKTANPSATGLMGAPFTQATPPAQPQASQAPGFGGVPGLSQYSTNPDISSAANAALGRYNAIVGNSKTSNAPQLISTDQQKAVNTMRSGMTGAGGQFAQENQSMRDWAAQMLGASKAGEAAADKMTALSDQEANATRGFYTGDYLKTLQDEAARSEALSNRAVQASLATLGAGRNAMELTGVGGSSIVRDSMIASLAGKLALQNALKEAEVRRANILANTEAQRSFYGLAPAAVANANAVRSAAAQLPGQTIPVMSALSASQQARLGAFPAMEQANWMPTYYNPQEFEARNLGLLGGYANLSNLLNQYSYNTPETPSNFIVPGIGGRYRDYGGLGGTYIEPAWNYDMPSYPQLSAGPQTTSSGYVPPGQMPIGSPERTRYEQQFDYMMNPEKYQGLSGSAAPSRSTAPYVVGNTAYQYNPDTGQYEVVAQYNP